MSKYKDMSNNQILLNIKQMEYDYDNLKQKMLTDWDKLMEIEEDFKEANKIITERLKGNTNN